MGRRNFLVEGVSCSGKTSVAEELERRGHQVVHGDRELAYQGDPETGEATDTRDHAHHLWHVDRVRAVVSDHREPITFFCGGSRNLPRFVDLFDGVFVLDIDRETLVRRLDARPESEYGGGDPAQRELVLRMHASGADTPDGTRVDATAALTDVVDEILRLVDEQTAS